MIGKLLADLNQAMQWWLGDWWNAGERYGRQAFVASGNWIGPSEPHCNHAGDVSRAFVRWQRHPGVPFAHHARVSDLPLTAAHELLTWCEQQRDRQGYLPTLRDLILYERNRQENSVPASPPSDAQSDGNQP